LGNVLLFSARSRRRIPCEFDAVGVHPEWQFDAESRVLDLHKSSVIPLNFSYSNGMKYITSARARVGAEKFHVLLMQERSAGAHSESVRASFVHVF
jgi:hypothetical protein